MPWAYCGMNKWTISGEYLWRGINAIANGRQGKIMQVAVPNPPPGQSDQQQGWGGCNRRERRHHLNAHCMNLVFLVFFISFECGPTRAAATHRQVIGGDAPGAPPGYEALQMDE